MAPAPRQSEPVLEAARVDGVPGKIMVIEDVAPRPTSTGRSNTRERALLVLRTEGESDLARNGNVHVHIPGPTHVFAPDGSRLGDG